MVYRLHILLGAFFSIAKTTLADLNNSSDEFWTCCLYQKYFLLNLPYPPSAIGPVYAVPISRYSPSKSAFPIGRYKRYTIYNSSCRSSSVFIYYSKSASLLNNLTWHTDIIRTTHVPVSINIKVGVDSMLPFDAIQAWASSQVTLSGNTLNINSPVALGYSALRSISRTVNVPHGGSIYVAIRCHPSLGIIPGHFVREYVKHKFTSGLFGYSALRSISLTVNVPHGRSIYVAIRCHPSLGIIPGHFVREYIKHKFTSGLFGYSAFEIDLPYSKRSTRQVYLCCHSMPSKPGHHPRSLCQGIR